jgi:uncharacterized membrane protein (DUF485 family)
MAAAPRMRLGMSDRAPHDPHDQATAPSRLGLGLFAIYVLLYGGFMVLVLVRPDLLASRPFGGVNLAIAAGLGLIGAAVLLSALYMIARPE